MENDRRNYFMINLHESMGPDKDQTCDPNICTNRVCSQTPQQAHIVEGAQWLSGRVLDSRGAAG